MSREYCAWHQPFESKLLLDIRVVVVRTDVKTKGVSAIALR